MEKSIEELENKKAQLEEKLKKQKLADEIATLEGKISNKKKSKT